MKKYNSSLDLFAAIIPIIMILGALYLLLSNISANMALALIVFVIFSYLGTTTSILVNDNSIVIYQALAPKTINFSDIKSVNKLDGITYAFGNGRDMLIYLFGYAGIRYRPGYGMMRWYCTQLKNFIIIETDNNKYVISPNDRDAVLADIKQRCPSIVSNKVL